MNIIEAVRTRRPIRRKTWADYLTLQRCPCDTWATPHWRCSEAALMFPSYIDPKLSPADILADDWETAPEGWRPE